MPTQLAEITMNLTQEQKRIKIAESCGWKKETLEDSQWACGSHGCTEQTHVKWLPPGGGYAAVQHEYNTPNVPDYFNDLNAMQSAVLSQSEDLQGKFDSALKNSGKRIASMMASEWAEIFCGLLNANSIN